MMSNMKPEEILSMDPGQQAKMQIQLMEMMKDPNVVSMVSGMVPGMEHVTGLGTNAIGINIDSVTSNDPNFMAALSSNTIDSRKHR